jgi:hypothetical protein
VCVLCAELDSWPVFMVSPLQEELIEAAQEELRARYAARKQAKDKAPRQEAIDFAQRVLSEQVCAAACRCSDHFGHLLWQKGIRTCQCSCHPCLQAMQQVNSRCLLV